MHIWHILWTWSKYCFKDDLCAYWKTIFYKSTVWKTDQFRRLKLYKDTHKMDAGFHNQQYSHPPIASDLRLTYLLPLTTSILGEHGRTENFINWSSTSIYWFPDCEGEKRKATNRYFRSCLKPCLLTASSSTQSDVPGHWKSVELPGADFSALNSMPLPY